MSCGAALMVDLLRFHPLVARDLEEAIGWYESISVQLGNRFRNSVNSCFDSIQFQPESFALTEGTLRAARVGRFPYLVIFEFQTDFVEIIGVFHGASDATKWRGRR